MFSTRKESFSSREQRILLFWKENDVFRCSLEQRKKGPLFSFYDGPPFATGLPHYGHLLAGIIKDVIPRYWTMQGYFVPRTFGWDCHGLPIENEIENTRNLSGTAAIEQFGIANFNEECRSIVLRYTKAWQATVERIGRWVDITHAYKTMDLSFMETVWWVFKKLYEQGLVYRGLKVMPFSLKLGTPLSNFEANLNYREVHDPSLTIQFSLVDEPKTCFLAWTTTPWTLISNLALVVHPEIEYVKVYDTKKDAYYILAKARLEHYAPQMPGYKIVQTYLGKDLEGTHYHPLFAYFKDQKGFRVLVDSFVSTEDGTGIVHAAPAFGEVDFFVCEKARIPAVCPIDQNGMFTEEVPDLQGIFVKDADKLIIKRLKKEHKVFHSAQILHRYPFCWRSDTPLIYKAVETWFINVEKIKPQILQSNEQIQWVPEHIKYGRFGKWLVNARDWAVSRNRYWGTPIPIWKADDGSITVIGSVRELEEKTSRKIQDLHRHYIDDCTFEQEGKVYKRIPEVFDCWFESGSMPYAQYHYPFSNKELARKSFPADFIAEGLDQTRGWFYTLNVLSTALFQKPAFKNVIVNGIILAEDGNKMSKRLKNYPEPMEVIQKYGADAVRLYLLHSPAVKGEDLKFSEKGVELILKQFLLPLWNAYVFLSTYATIYDWTPSREDFLPKAAMDRWIFSCLERLVVEVQTAVESYHLYRAVEPFVFFIEQLTNWYIRRSRVRFWSEDNPKDRDAAFQTLYTVLYKFTHIAAPFIPFLSDAIYQELRTDDSCLSVHLGDYPKYRQDVRDHVLEKEMQWVQRAVSLGHSLRKEHKLKVRQPLAQVHIAVSDAHILRTLEKQKHLILDELNVKRLDLHDTDRQFVHYKAIPNFRVLGKKVGGLMPLLKEKMQTLLPHQIHTLVQGDVVPITIEDCVVQLTPEDVVISKDIKENLIAAKDEDLVLALDTQLSPELLMEGLAREMINKINTMRRENQLYVTDRIRVTLQTTDRVRSCFEEYRDLIQQEVLATEISFGACEGVKWDINGEPTIIQIAKV
jgi:isoleucyl-tRNA synthetase